MSDDFKGTVFNGRYTILERIGAGGMATVYRAHDEKSSSFVAVKILSREFLDQNPKEAERNLRRFKREAEILRILESNTYVVGFVEHSCSEGGDWFIAMELLEGEQLSYFIRRGKDVLPTHTLLHYGLHLVQGLKGIHEKQILHRDLAPDNIVLVKDADGIRVPRFLDFGIGKSIGGELDQVTEMLTIMGKPQYFSPEQARGMDLTPASDVYALGVVLYQMVTGHVPLELRGIPDFKKIQKDPPIPIANYREGQRIPPELQSVIMRCLAKTPEDRPLLDEVLEVVEAVRERANAGEVFQDATTTPDYTTPVPLRTESETGTKDGYFFFPEETPPTELVEGDTVNRYVIKQLVGRGGMGAVYEAWDPDLRRKVALKVATQIEEEKAKKRVLNEARASAALRCENIVTIYDVGTDGGTPFISMEFVEGKTLAQVIEEEGALSGQRFWEIASGLCEGLSLAHDRDEPVIHRDMKPANVLVHRHVAKITDFGIAKVTRRSTGAQGQETGGHDVGGGTAATMSPEQINDQPVDNRSDLYSLGCVLYMMATGRGPFQGNQIAIVYQHCNAEPAPPSKIATEISPELDRIILKLLAKEPEERHQNAAEVLDDLRAVFAPDEIPSRAWYRSPVAMVAAVALVVATIAVIQILTPDPSPIVRNPFGIRFVRADNFEPGATYYVREDAVNVTVVGQEGTVFDSTVRAEGEEVEDAESTLGAEPLIHEIQLHSNKSDAATTYDVTLLAREDAAEPFSFTVIHDPTPPQRTVITHGGHREPLGQTVRAMHGSDVVFEIVDEESGFRDGSGGRITRWRSDEGESLESVWARQPDPANPDSWTLEVTDLTGRQFNSEVKIVRMVPRLRNPPGLLRTNRESLRLTLDLTCPPFDLTATPLADGDVTASMGTVATPVKRTDSRYTVDLTLPPIGEAAVRTHSVAFDFRGQPMPESVEIVHDPVAPALQVTYSPVGEEA
ncbi:MAG: serine/threonine protein kinase, partial [Planctomycetes bacterium]|nr:serine/threonine protein kinase [Planctomycetota bacterium]